MEYFTYDKKSPNIEYYDLLSLLIDRWEYEIVEFKEASGQYSTDKIGQYFSAISNEANLKNQQYGWLILGVSEKDKKHICGTSFKNGNISLLENFKYEIAKSTTGNITFTDIIEIYPIVNGKPKRILMFKIPAAAIGIPTGWKNVFYARAGESLINLQQFKIDQIRRQERSDWSKQIVPNATIEHLDKDAIALAREKYKEKMNRAHIAEEIDSLSDEQFLGKLKLVIDGQLTNAAIVLLGSSEYDYKLQYPPSVMWRLIDKDGSIKDYSIFTIPFITVVDKIFSKIRNLTYRYMPDQMSLFPKETQQYDAWLLRELINNCIAHSNYQLGGRIYVNEFEESITITNPGNFLPENIETVLQPTYNPPFYRNWLLADAMVNFHMIDTATSGIKKIYRIQKEKYFPMPDYDLSKHDQVEVTVYGKIIDEKYTYMLFRHPELTLETVYLLDKVQKKQPLSKEAVAHLRKHKLVEGRINNLYLSAEIAQSIDEEAKYIKNKGFNDQYYKDMIVDFINKFGKANRKQIDDLLWDKLPAVLDEKQKKRKVLTLLTYLRQNNVIVTDSDNRQTCNWIIKK